MAKVMIPLDNLNKELVKIIKQMRRYDELKITISDDETKAKVLVVNKKMYIVDLKKDIV